MASSDSGSRLLEPESTTNMQPSLATTLFGIIDKSMDFIGNSIGDFLNGNSETESLPTQDSRDNAQRVAFSAEVQTPSVVGTVQLGRPRHNSTGIAYQTPRPNQIRTFLEESGDDSSSESDADHCMGHRQTIASFEKQLKDTVQNAQNREFHYQEYIAKQSKEIQNIKEQLSSAHMKLKEINSTNSSKWSDSTSNYVTQLITFVRDQNAMKAK